MDKYYKIDTMSKYKKEWIEAQKKAEKLHGMKDNHFFIENDTVIQFVNCKEADEFYNTVDSLKNNEFEIICNNFLKEIKKQNPNKIKMFYALTVFDEMDNYNLGTLKMKKLLLKIREETHEISYKI